MSGGTIIFTSLLSPCQANQSNNHSLPCLQALSHSLTDAHKDTRSTDLKLGHSLDTGVTLPHADLHHAAHAITPQSHTENNSERTKHLPLHGPEYLSPQRHDDPGCTMATARAAAAAIQLLVHCLASEKWKSNKIK